MTVYLVGAGPGDPGLITIRGAEVLSRAEVILYDRLVGLDLLDSAPAGAVLIDVGKRPGDPSPRRQSEINELLVEHGRSARTVVRLKGGDPFVFGRGGEEAEALLAAGVPFEVVPGVSAAFAVPASAGVPVTHRGMSRSVTVVTGHVGGAEGGGDVDWEALARAGGTVVVMMGMQNRAEIARRLVAAGRSPATPVLVVRHGTTAHQKSTRCTLETLVDVDLEAPSTIVVGEVAGLDLSSVRAGPLSGMSVVVTRATEQSGPVVSELAAHGAHVMVLPVIAIAAPSDGEESLRRAAAELAAGRYRWAVFTSVNAVGRLLVLVRDARALAGTGVAAVGRATTAALAAHGIVADLVPEVSTAEGLAAAMPRPSREEGERSARVLFPRAEHALEILAPRLRDKGWEVDEVVAYRTVAASLGDGLSATTLEAASGADVVTFTSPSTVRCYLEVAAGRHVPGVVACIGPSTAHAAREAGLKVDVVAQEHTAEGLVASLVRFFGHAPA